MVSGSEPVGVAEGRVFLKFSKLNLRLKHKLLKRKNELVGLRESTIVDIYFLVPILQKSAQDPSEVNDVDSLEIKS